MKTRLTACMTLVASLAATSLVLAQPAGDPRALAERHFRIGLDLVREQAWDAALAEFTRSREAMPTANASENSAVCLRELGRFDEALDEYEALLAGFGAKVPATERRAVDDDMARLQHFVGRVDVVSDPPGATVVVDGRIRGTTALAAPLRVSVGTRSVRLTRAGYAPYETRVMVASGDTAHVTVRLAAVSQLGHLRVEEHGGARCELSIDGVVVGATPWEGTLTAGGHSVASRCEHDVGTSPTEVQLAMGDSKRLLLAAGALPGELRIEPSPADARVSIDGREVSRGSWSGMIPSGDHVVDVAADWHASERLPVRVSSATPQSLRPALTEVPRMYVDLWGGPVMLFGMSDRGIPQCSSCEGTFVALGGGYKVTEHFGVELYVLYSFLDRKSQRSLTTTVPWPPGTASASSYVEDAQLSMLAAGGAVRYRFFDHTPLTLRMLAAVSHSSSLATAGGTFYGTNGNGSLEPLNHLSVDSNYWSPFIGPDIRFGYQFRPGMTFDVGLGVFAFVAPSTRPDGNPPYHDVAAALPPGPSFGGGLGYIVPLTGDLHFEL